MNSDSEQQLGKFNGGLVLDTRKSMSDQSSIVQACITKQYIIPVQQHIGEPGELIVETGQRVLKGQMLSQPKQIVSAAVHSPVSGTVKDIGHYPVPHPSGLEGLCVVIENDFEDERVHTEAIGDMYQQMTSHDLRVIIRDAGIVGLGGAGFPAAVKQTEIDLRTLIINGVECEPYITCDNALMCERAREVLAGADIIGHVIKARECIIAIEDNMPQAITAMQKAVDEDGTGFFRVQPVPTIYPSGGERQLIQLITGKEVPMNGLPADLGVLCHNVGTAYAAYRAIYHNEPLISRIVTVTGHGVKQPQNLEVPIGTEIRKLIEQCGGYSDDVSSVIMGGPMMGFTLESDTLSVEKVTNCLLVATEQDIHMPESSAHMPCIRCGKCADVCPARLLPQQLYWYASSKNFEKTVEYNLFDCIECGCCAYVCPSRIPLVQYYRYAKSEIWEQEEERKYSDIARRRYEYRNLRLERQKQEREQRLRKKREQLEQKKGKKKNENDKQKDAIAAALERVNENKKKKNVKPKNTDNLTPEQIERIRAADKRRTASKNRQAD